MASLKRIEEVASTDGAVYIIVQTKDEFKKLGYMQEMKEIINKYKDIWTFLTTINFFKTIHEINPISSKDNYDEEIFANRIAFENIRQISTFSMPIMDIPINELIPTNIKNKSCLFMWRKDKDGIEYMHYAKIYEEGYISKPVWCLPINLWVLLILMSVYQKIPTIKPSSFPNIEMYTCEMNNSSLLFTQTNSDNATVISVANEGGVAKFADTPMTSIFNLDDIQKNEFCDLVERFFLRKLNIKMKATGNLFTLSRSSDAMTPARKKHLETYPSPP